jgi:hypothetical protein
MKVGSEYNPIKLVNESICRELLVKFATNTAVGVFDFHSLPDFGRDCYLLNVLYNPHLTPYEVKLAVFFHEELIDGGKIYTTSFSEKFMPALSYGDVFQVDDDYVDGIAFGTEESLRSGVIYSNNGYYPSLPGHTQSMGMKLTSQRIINLLKRLHKFGYITVTDITINNTYGLKAKAKVENPRARLRHIRLCKGMQNKDLTGRWIPK